LKLPLLNSGTFKDEWQQALRETCGLGKYLLYADWQAHVHETKQQIAEWPSLRADDSQGGRRDATCQSH